MNVVIADNDDTRVAVMQESLRETKHTVAVYQSASATITRVREAPPHVVIVGRTTAETDGTTLCRLLRQEPRAVDVCLVLIIDIELDAKAAEAVGSAADHYISTPIHPRIFAGCMELASKVVLLREQVESERQTVRSQVAELGVLTRKLRSAALTDFLTDLPNRRYADKKLQQLWGTSIANRRDLSILLIDIDRLKAVNDTYGHAGGDAVFQGLGHTVRSSVGRGPEAARWGGDEFIVLCADSSGKDALTVAERVRCAVAAHQVCVNDLHFAVTVSLGVASRSDRMRAPEQLLLAADTALYQAKNGGRNQCVQWREI